MHFVATLLHAFLEKRIGSVGRFVSDLLVGFKIFIEGAFSVIRPYSLELMIIRA